MQKQVYVEEEASEDKAQLVELFKRIAMPQSQRSRFSAKASRGTSSLVKL